MSSPGSLTRRTLHTSQAAFAGRPAAPRCEPRVRHGFGGGRTVHWLEGEREDVHFALVALSHAGVEEAVRVSLGAALIEAGVVVGPTQRLAPGDLRVAREIPVEASSPQLSLPPASWTHECDALAAVRSCACVRHVRGMCAAQAARAQGCRALACAWRVHLRTDT